MVHELILVCLRGRCQQRRGRVGKLRTRRQQRAEQWLKLWGQLGPRCRLVRAEYKEWIDG